MPTEGSRRILFVKDSLQWPHRRGGDIHTSHMMRALIDLGHDVGITTWEPLHDDALHGAELAFRGSVVTGSELPEDELPPLTALQNRFRSYFGIEQSWIRRVGLQVRDFQADAVVVSGVDVLPFLAAAGSAVRIWYTADEWILHHLSQVRLGDPKAWANFREAALKGVYERAFAGLVDRVWVVSERESRATRWLAGMGTTDVLPNGVDVDYYQPVPDEASGPTAVFWGRLDFGPNVQALRWFLERVWPEVLRRVPDAVFTIVGSQPSDDVRCLADHPGVELRADLPDLRTEVGRHSLVALPFVSGSGIKNKLLEAAAMGRPVQCTPRAHLGIQGTLREAVVLASSRGEWIERLIELWNDPARRRSLGQAARTSVVESHPWGGAAVEALAGIEASLSARRVTCA